MYKKQKETYGISWLNALAVITILILSEQNEIILILFEISFKGRIKRKMHQNPIPLNLNFSNSSFNQLSTSQMGFDLEIKYCVNCYGYQFLCSSLGILYSN